MSAEVTLSYVLSEFRSRLTTAAEAADPKPFEKLTLQDVVPPRKTTGTPRIHRSVRVNAGSSRNTDTSRNKTLARAEDSIVVALSYRLNAASQHAHQDAALDHAEAVREWLTASTTWLGSLHVLWRGTTRATDRSASEVYVITQTYTVTRDAVLGG